MTSTAIGRPAPLVAPDAGGGLRQVVRQRFLLRLLVRRELRARYKSSLLGMGWSYVRPAVNFSVYFFVVGTFLGVSDKVEDFAVYLFSGMVLVHLFTEILHSTTRSVTGHAALIRKVFLPRELFPTTSVLLSVLHFVPGLVILMCAALAAGWRFSADGLVAAVLGFTIVTVLGMGIGLLLAAGNVFFRDLEQIVDVTSVIIVWSVPMIYPWTVVRDAVPGWVLDAYLANPLVTAASLFQRAFWLSGTRGTFDFPPHLYTRAGVALAVAGLVFVCGQQTFAGLERRFGQEL